MFERFNGRARQVVVLAQDEARALRHSYVGTEHLLLGLLREEEGLAARVLGSLEITVEIARAQVARIVGMGDNGATGSELPFTARARRALEQAVREALALGQNDVGTEHILLGLTRGDGVAKRILLDLDADADRIRNAVAQLLAGPRDRSAGGLPPPTPRPGRGSGGAAWEYRVETLAPGDRDELTGQLNELGSKGWQLAATVDASELQLIFQRPVAESATSGSTRVHSSSETPEPRAWTRETITVESGITLRDFSQALGVPTGALIRLLMDIHSMKTAVHTLTDEEIGLIAERLGRSVEILRAEPRHQPPAL